MMGVLAALESLALYTLAHAPMADGAAVTFCEEGARSSGWDQPTAAVNSSRRRA